VGRAKRTAEMGRPRKAMGPRPNYLWRGHDPVEAVSLFSRPTSSNVGDNLEWRRRVFLGIAKYVRY
jgi:hypothetical protein